MSFDPAKVALEAARNQPRPVKGPGTELLQEVAAVRPREVPENKGLAKIAQDAGRGV